MLIGLIANPVSSKDIRRLTGLARVVAAEEKANLLGRLLVGLGSDPEMQLLALDDRAGLVRAVADLRSRLHRRGSGADFRRRVGELLASVG